MSLCAKLYFLQIHVGLFVTVTKGICDYMYSKRRLKINACDVTLNSKPTYTKHGPGSMDHPMDPVHGPPWTTPWTTPNFQKDIAPVNMKIYRRSGFEKHRLLHVSIAYILEGLSLPIYIHDLYTGMGVQLEL